jgi:hypothetical protein
VRWVGFLQTLNEKPGSARTLRSFLGQVIKDAGFYCLPLQRAFYLDHVPAIPRKPHPYDIKDQYSKEIFAKIFGLLERHETDWVQAHFIRLLFEFGVPADRLMKAEWRHIVDGRWYPWLQNERKYWRLHFRNVDNTISALLQKLRIRGKKEFGDSPFLFPSRLSSSGTSARSEHFGRELHGSVIWPSMI